MSYVYIESENYADDDGNRHHLYTVGHYKPDGKFEPDSDHASKGAARDSVAFLNGGAPWYVWDAIKQAMDWYLEAGVPPGR